MIGGKPERLLKIRSRSGEIQGSAHILASLESADALGPDEKEEHMTSKIKKILASLLALAALALGGAAIASVTNGGPTTITARRRRLKSTITTLTPTRTSPPLKALTTTKPKTVRKQPTPVKPFQSTVARRLKPPRLPGPAERSRK